jgi:hypothetical protein
LDELNPHASGIEPYAYLKAILTESSWASSLGEIEAFLQIIITDDENDVA